MDIINVDEIIMDEMDYEITYYKVLRSTRCLHCFYVNNNENIITDIKTYKRYGYPSFHRSKCPLKIKDEEIRFKSRLEKYSKTTCLSNYKLRKKSFDGVKLNISERVKNKLSLGGFFYSGKDRIAECTYCEINLIIPFGLNDYTDNRIISKRYEPLLDHCEDSKNCVNSKFYKEILSSEKCVICIRNKKSIIFIPCGHFISCKDCAFKIKDCAVCRCKITSRSFPNLKTIFNVLEYYLLNRNEMELKRLYLNVPCNDIVLLKQRNTENNCDLCKNKIEKRIIIFI